MPSPNDRALLSTESFYFYLYLNKTSNSRFEQQSTDTPSGHGGLTLYRVINTLESIKAEDSNAYEYNLTNLSNIQYMFYLSARYERLESQLAGPLVIHGPRKILLIAFF